ncbi:interleukin-1 receptor type 1 isoform X3 [Nothobranchius furzeri]|uniref:interleukin-1 receptor type 1 isoform X3 n=1 Tax=Nothobranchius furzeri TaxID=105023 RepID=UPI0024045BC3|nr:interleukin-1 receptor type 1 isoform X2 [Nothobranchius furzeri]
MSRNPDGRKLLNSSDHSGETDTYHVSAGHMFLLGCSADAHSVNWRRGDNRSIPTGVEAVDGLLWFLPLQMSHNGTYICEKREKTGSSKRRFSVLVSSADCPDSNEEILITEGVRGGLPCKQTEIFSLNVTRRVRWMKDSNLVQLDEESTYVGEDGFLRLPAVTDRDAGKYTCIINVIMNGTSYTAARSIQLTVRNEPPEVFPELQVVKPLQDVFLVQVGERAELQCLVYTGFSEDPEILMYWTINGIYISDYEELNETWHFVHDRGKVYGQSNLSISKVLHQFLNVPILCHISSPAEKKFGLAWLQEADLSDFYLSMILFLSASLVILVLAVSFYCLKVDLVLAYRKLLRHFSTQVSDGKLYDAYVSVVQSDVWCLCEAERFALQVLPEELEQKHGYSLFIRGRDDSPGEAVHDVIATTLHQCRRLIIILSPDIRKVETELLHENQNQLWFELNLGLHDALLRNDPKVILVEVDGPVDYCNLPESLCFIKRKQGALKWKNKFCGANQTTTYSKSVFWKKLRYCMPAVGTGNIQSAA